MSRLDEWAAAQWKGISAGLTQGAGDIARAAWADIGNTYQAILTQDATVGTPVPPTGDMLVTHAPAPPFAASDGQLRLLIAAQASAAASVSDIHALAQQAAAAELEGEIAGPDIGVEPAMEAPDGPSME